MRTIALVCSPKIGNDRQPWKLLVKLTKISYPVKIWERFNIMGAIIYSKEYIVMLCKKDNVLYRFCKKLAISVLKSTKNGYQIFGKLILTTISANVGLK